MRRTLLLLLLSTPALAQTAPPAGNQLNQLLDALHAAPSPEIAQALEAQLEEVWLNAGSPAVRLLMGRGLRELKASNYKEAVEAFGDVVTLDPNSPEGYRQLALSRYAAGDPRGAIEDLAPPSSMNRATSLRISLSPRLPSSSRIGRALTRLGRKGLALHSTHRTRSNGSSSCR